MAWSEKVLARIDLQVPEGTTRHVVNHEFGHKSKVLWEAQFVLTNSTLMRIVKRVNLPEKATAFGLFSLRQKWSS